MSRSSTAKRKKFVAVSEDFSQIKITSSNVEEVLNRISRTTDFRQESPLFLIVDLFCGAGGTTTGFDLAERMGNKLAKVIACVNHDPNAIVSHWQNHPDVFHFEEDIRTLNLDALVKIVDYYRRLYPDALLVLTSML